MTRGATYEMDPPGGEHQEETTDNDLLYTVEETPPWYLCLLLGFQQFLTMFGATFAYPVLISGAICITGDDVGLGELISTVIFVSGLSSILQSTFGVRLPIIQSVSYSFLTPTFVLLSLEAQNCPYNDPTANLTSLPEKGSDGHKDIWQYNLRELQGCLMVASLLSIVIGFSGIIGFLLKFIGPLTIAPTICLITLSLFGTAANYGSVQWYICFTTLFLVALFSQYLRNIGIPIPFTKRKLKFFGLFPVLLAVVIAWVICVILTVTDTLPDDPDKWGYGARTDTRRAVLDKAEWFRFPYPGQWGVPRVSLAGVLGMLAAVFASTIESVGDYYACARLAGAPPPPGSAVSRGIGMEGITCLLAGAWGAGGGNTSYSENIGAIGITKVGSRIVIQVAGVIMVILGCLGKFGALFVTIPEPVVGGLFYAMFGMVAAVGISNLQFVDLNSTRNLFVFGVSLVFGLSVPNWVTNNSSSINTGNSNVDQVLTVLSGTSMFVGGFLAFILDNTIPGTKKERGLLDWKKVEGSVAHSKVYDLPLIQPWLNRLSWTKYLPFCPGFVLDHKTDHSDEINSEMTTGEDNKGFQPEAVNNVQKKESIQTTL